MLTTEADAIRRLVETIGEDFERAVEHDPGDCSGRVVWTGMGKSGIICRKLAATMRSTGTPALFLHPAEAIHGDLGMVTSEDLVMAISNSGATDEILSLVEVLKRQGISADRHVLPPRLAPGQGGGRPPRPRGAAGGLSPEPGADRLDHRQPRPWRRPGMAVSVRKGFREEDFVRLHPGGKLGKRFLKVGDLMHAGDELPRSRPRRADEGRDLRDESQGSGPDHRARRGRASARRHHRRRPCGG